MIKETTIKIGDKDYLIKKSYRSLLEFEEQTGKGINDMKESLKDLFTLFYCIVISNNKTDFTFDDFIDLIDKNQDAMDNFNQFLIDSATTVEDSEKKKVEIQ
jgi:hypothetical protein